MCSREINTHCCIKPWPPWQKKDTEEPEGIWWSTTAKGRGLGHLPYEEWLSEQAFLDL